MSELAISRRLDGIIWALIAGTALIVVLAPFVSDFRFVPSAFAAPAAAACALGAGALFYGRWRSDPRLAAALQSTTQVIVFAGVGAPLSYLAAATNLPLQDHLLAHLDAAFGFDWKAALAFMNAHPTLYDVLGPIYLSLTLQMTTAVLCLAFSGRLIRLRVYTLAFVLAALVTIAISAVFPAAGAWPYFGIEQAASSHVLPAVHTSWPVFYGLRDGNFRDLVAIGSEGIITFPSLHAALAVILVVALWPIAVVRWVAVIVNLAMLTATPVDGSHYFVDVFGGVAVAVITLAVAQALAAQGRATRASSRTARAESTPALASD